MVSHTLLTRERRQACIGSDAVKPGPERGVAPKASAAVPRTEERLLRKVFRIFARTEDPIGVCKYLSPVAG
jgi:hypothetical protein